MKKIEELKALIAKHRQAVSDIRSGKIYSSGYTHRKQLERKEELRIEYYGKMIRLATEYADREDYVTSVRDKLHQRF